LWSVWSCRSCVVDEHHLASFRAWRSLPGQTIEADHVVAAWSGRLGRCGSDARGRGLAPVITGRACGLGRRGGLCSEAGGQHGGGPCLLAAINSSNSARNRSGSSQTRSTNSAPATSGNPVAMSGATSRATPGRSEGRTRWRTQPRCPILVAVRPGLGSRPGSGVPDSGEATGRRPNTPRPPAGRGGRGTGSGVDLLLSGVGAGDSDLAGLGPLRDRDPQRQHTGVVAGLDPVGVEGLAEEQLA
jgi:hypothetical protein